MSESAPRTEGNEPAQAKKTESDQFKFPVSVQAGMIFDNEAELMSAIMKERDEAPYFLPKPYIHKRKQEGLYYGRIPCEYCKAAVNFKGLENGKIQIMTVWHDHLHTTAKFNDPVEEEVYRFYKVKQKEGTPDEHLEKAVLKEFGISVTTYRRLSHLFRDFEVNDFKELEEWLKENNYEYRYDWKQEPTNKYPRLLVMASQKMKDSFTRFGDLVAFDITYGLLRNIASDGRRYRVGVFTVRDTNMRMLLAGIAILVDETAEGLFAMFQYFIQVHGRAPGSIITDDQQTIATAVTLLQNNGFFVGAHMLDPWHLLKAIRPKLNSSVDKIK